MDLRGNLLDQIKSKQKDFDSNLNFKIMNKAFCFSTS